MDQECQKGTVVKDTLVMSDVPECSKRMSKSRGSFNKITEQEDVLVPPYPSYLPYTGDTCLLPAMPFKSPKHHGVDLSSKEKYLNNVNNAEIDEEQELPKDYSIKTRRRSSSSVSAVNPRIPVLHEDLLIPPDEYDVPDSSVKASNMDDNDKELSDYGEMDLLNDECIFGFLCRFCSASCDDLPLLDEHVRECHALESRPDILFLHPYQGVRCSFCTVEVSLCFQCGEEFTDDAVMKKHTGIHKAAGCFTCKICSLALPVKNNEFHLYTHENLLPACNECNRKVTQPYENIKPMCKVKPMRQDLAKPTLLDPIKKKKKDPIVLIRRLQIEPGVISVRLKQNENEEIFSAIRTSDTSRVACHQKKKSVEMKSIGELFPISTVQSDQPLFCDECGYCYFSFTELEIHKKTHTRPQSFETSLHAQVQECAEIEYTVTRHPCTFCEAEFYSEKVLDNHMIAHIGDNILCLICGENFNQLYDLDRHLQIHDVEAVKADLEKNTTCEYCFGSFLNKKELIKHKRSECFLSCNICSQICVGEVNLGVHTEVHKITEKIASECESELSFDGNIELFPKPSPQKHQKKRKRRSSTLTKRKRKKSEVQSPGCFQCLECGSEFMKKEDLNVHRIKVHLPPNNGVPGSEFHCKLCDAKFSKRSSYVSHLWEVHDEKMC